MKKNKLFLVNAIIIFVLTVWWTFFLGNLAYMLISNQVNSRLVELYYKPEVNGGDLVENQ